MSEIDPRPWRRHFPILETSNYLISNSLGAMPAGVEAQMQRYLDLWKQRGVRSWSEEWWTLGDDLADALAPILGAPTGSVSMQPNVSLATALVLSALEDRPGSRIVTTELQFPSVLYVLDRWCRRRDVELEVVASDTDFGTSTQRLVDAIDGDTRAVVISHVEFKTAWIHDAREIAARCRENDAFLLLDVFQSAGILPVELASWGVDAAVGGCLKWLCGGPGNAFLYVDPERAESLTSNLTGWMSHPRPFAFEPPPLEPAPTHRRFLHGTPPIPAFYAARPGVDLIREAQVGLIRKRSLRMTTKLFELASERGWKVASPPDPSRRGGTISLDLEHAEAISRELAEREVIVDYRPGVGMRISPHFYNTDAECEDCIAAIEDIVDDGSWKRHASVGGKSPT